MTEYIPMLATIFMVFTVFLLPNVWSVVKDRFTPSGMKISLISFVVAVVVAVIGFVLSLDMDAMNMWVVFLLSVGITIFMSVGVLCFLFIATIPEDMEKESEDE